MTGGRILAVLTGVAALAAAPAWAPAAAHKTRTVSVNDNYYGPSKLTVHVGDTVRWRWSADAWDVHDVKLAKGPKGAKAFASEPLAAGQAFSRALTKAGTYRIICTFHEQEMTMTVTVRRRPGT